MANRSEVTMQIGGGDQQVAPQTSSSSQMMTSSSSSKQSFSSTSSSGSSSTKTTSTKTTTTKKTTMTSTKSYSSRFLSSNSSNISIKSASDSFSDMFSKSHGIDVDKEMKSLMGSMDNQSDRARQSIFNLMPLENTAGTDLIKLDSKSMMDFVDKNDKDNLRFNFDISECTSESVSVKSDGNKIEVHAKKSMKKGDEEHSEEFSRTYEMPTSGAIDPAKVTSSVYKDGILTVLLPVNMAIDSGK